MKGIKAGDTGRPNILWISVEDTSPRFGCYGDALARTPNIDRLAAEGVCFTQAYATAGACAPSRSAIITGMYATSIGTHHMRTSHTDPFAPELPTPYDAVPPHYVKMFTEYLRAAGYYCTNNVKTDYQFAVPKSSATPVTGWDDCSKEAHWRGRAVNQPFFAVFNTMVTHESCLWSHANHTLKTNPDQVKVPAFLPDTQTIREAIARQYDNIADADQFVGRLLEQLTEDQLQEDTIVFLWSDHGEGFPRSKHTLYDGGIHVPLIVRHPGLRHQAGSSNDQVVSLVDLAPTVLSLAGIAIPRHLQGAPFMGPHAQVREYAFAAKDRSGIHYDMIRSVRDQRYKYIRHEYPQPPSLPWGWYIWPHPMFQELEQCYLNDQLNGPAGNWLKLREPEELYDCESDPDEVNNLVADPEAQPILVRMRTALQEWRNNYGDLGELSETEILARMWPGGVQPCTAAPLFVPMQATGRNVEPIQSGASIAYHTPTFIRLYCATQGASIAYTTEESDQPHWLLYTEPIQLEAGRTVLRAKAVRLGYKESEERNATFHIGLERVRANE